MVNLIYNVAIVGLGRMGHLFEDDTLNRKKPCTHAGAYDHLKDKVRIVSVCDLREDRLKLFKNKWGVNNLYVDYKRMLDNEKIDILSVCTHAEHHKDIVIYAANKGVKAIFCEKPIAASLKDAQEMIDVCKEKNVVLYIDNTRRFDNQWRKVREVVTGGLIGDLKVISSFAPAGLLNGGTHLFDLLLYYNGEVDSVYGKISEDESTDPSGTGWILFKNGTMAFVDIDFREYVYFNLSLIGSKGSLRIGGMIRGDKTFDLGVSEKSPTQDGVMELKPHPIPDFEEGDVALVNAVNEIIDSIETGKKPVSSGEDGLAALEIAMAFYESDKLGKPVKLPIENRDRIVIPRRTSYIKSGEFPISYERDNILPMN